MKKKIGIVGYGALCKIFLELFEIHLKEDYELGGILIKNSEKRLEIAKENFTPYENLGHMLKDNLDYVIEFASASAVREYGAEILKSGINLVVVSVGALEDEKLYNELEKASKEGKSNVHLASGAIGGFDLMRTFALDPNANASIKTFKSPESLEGAPHLEGVLLSQKEEQSVFKGNGRDAIKGFPKNVNVAVATSLAVSGVEKTEVEIFSVPGLEENTHEISLENSVAKANIKITSKKDLKNPKSSVITAWSVVALLKNLSSPIKFF